MLLVFTALVFAAPTTQEVMTLARQQLAAPAEFALDEMKVYRGDQLNRSYTFVMGKLWDEENQTEFVRIDFQSAINSGTDLSSLYSDHRYLLKRTGQNAPTQWLYLPALRRVRITPYRPDDPLLQSDSLFYDLTAITDLGDYTYRFVDANMQNPIVEGQPTTTFVPYQQTRFVLARQGDSYVIKEAIGVEAGKERHAESADFREVAPSRYRPHKLIVRSEGGRTELIFRQWTFVPATTTLFSPTHLETQSLQIPTGEPNSAPR
jgi:hypothetical protein